jgi:hypothetical protein
MLGTAAADWHTAGEINDLARALGVNTDDYFPIALSFWGVPPYHFRILAVRKDVAGGTFDDIQAYARSHGGVVPVVPFEFSGGLVEFKPYMKRLNVVLITRMEGLEAFDEQEAIDLDPARQ